MKPKRAAPTMTMFRARIHYEPRGFALIISSAYPSHNEDNQENRKAAWSKIAGDAIRLSASVFSPSSRPRNAKRNYARAFREPCKVIKFSPHPLNTGRGGSGSRCVFGFD
jgi:hypothetical protein